MSADSLHDDDSHDGEGEDDDAKGRKRKERLEQNRISARESRKRKKTMIEELQRTVITLSRENKDLNERNENLRRQLMEIGGKVRKKMTRAFESRHMLVISSLVLPLSRHVMVAS
jgi:predicted RNase H-like nuclease (RuvC/YqgF family)